MVTSLAYILRAGLLITAQIAFHYCTFQFITAHFVYHCTLKNSLLEAKAKARTLKVKAKAIPLEAKATKFVLKDPRGQGLASRTTSLKN